jgi:hypothetical protein
MRIRWTEPAVQDLKNICDYVGDVLEPAGSPTSCRHHSSPKARTEITSCA